MKYNRRPIERIKRFLHAENGMGLSESLVAVALLGTAVLSLVAALSTGSLGVSAMRESVTAQSLIQSQMACTKNYPFIPGAASYPAVDIYDVNYNPNPITLPPGYSITVEACATADADGGIQKITVTVFENGETILAAEDFKVDR